MISPHLVYLGLKFAQGFFNGLTAYQERNHLPDLTYTFYAVPPSRLEAFMDDTPSMPYEQFARMMANKGYPHGEIQKCLLKGAALEGQNPGCVVLVGNVRQS